jgi:MFS transporter, DHA2 family, multidrug resistance protein
MITSDASQPSNQTASALGEHSNGLPLGQRRVAYVALAIATAMSVLDGSIANTALPTIARDLHASPVQSIWVVNGFQLAVTASLFTFAALGQIRGGARVYRYGVILFVAGSLFCALSRSMPLLIAARAIQGLGASAIMAITPALLREIFPREQIGRALGINALVIATSAAAGPTIGGLLLAIAPWPWLFAINVPLGIANIALNRALPHDDRSGGSLDLLSMITSALGFALIIWGIDGFARHESALNIAVPLAFGALSAWWFVRRQFVLPVPMIALDLFRVRVFAAATGTSLASFTAQGLAYVSLPFYFQAALGRSPLDSGLLLTSWPVAVACVAPLAGRLSDRFPAAILSTIGAAVLTLGLGLYAAMGSDPSTLSIVVHGAICGLGFGFFQSPNNRELITSAPRSKSASAAGVLAAARLSGQTLGAALVAIVFGAFGAHEISANAAHEVVASATPAALWVACAFSGVATLASATRLGAPRKVQQVV